MTVFYVETSSNWCALIESNNLNDAKKEVLSDIGYFHGVKLARKATVDDIAWVRGMGGYVPKSACAKMR